MHIWRRLIATTLSRLLQTDVRCCRREKFLQKFWRTRPNIKIFCAAGLAKHKQLNDSQWLLDLAFLTDRINTLNDFNLELQGKENSNINKCVVYS